MFDKIESRTSVLILAEEVRALRNVTLDNFDEVFPSERACFDFVSSLKWPDGFRCPRCGHPHAYTVCSRRIPLFECRSCRHQTSLTAETIIEGSRTDLRKWLRALLLVSRAEEGTNAVQLSRELGVTYKTAWLMLHKIRRAISASDAREPLAGIVQVQAAVHGRPHNPTASLHRQESPLLVGASTDAEGQPFHVKMKLVSLKHMSEKLVTRTGTKAFTNEHVKADAHDLRIVTGRFSFHRFKSLLSLFKEARNWLNATFHGLERKYLQSYLDEFCFRWNAVRSGCEVFERLSRVCFGSV